MMTSGPLVPIIGVAAVGALLWAVLPLVRLLCGLVALGATGLALLTVVAPSTIPVVSPSLLPAASWIANVGAGGLRLILGFLGSPA